MDASRPLIFANQVIDRLVGNHHADDFVLGKKDYMHIRLVFRKRGGSWEDLYRGDPSQMDLLSKVIDSWAEQGNQGTDTLEDL